MKRSTVFRRFFSSAKSWVLIPVLSMRWKSWRKQVSKVSHRRLFQQGIKSLLISRSQFVIVNERKWNAIFWPRFLIHSSSNFITPIKPKGKFTWCSTSYVVVIYLLVYRKKVAREREIRAEMSRMGFSSSDVYRTRRSILSSRISLGTWSFTFTWHRLPRFETREHSLGHWWSHCVDGFRFIERIHSNPRFEDIFLLWNSGIHVTGGGVTQGSFPCGGLVVVWCSRFRDDHRAFTISWHQSKRNDEYDLES